MIRQNTAPIEFGRSIRPDYTSLITSAKAGVVAPILMIPHHRGDSASGRINVRMNLAEMPAPLENAVIARVQAWFVPRPSLPQFTGLDEYTHSFHGTDISQLGAAARTPPALFNTVGTGAIAAAQSSEFFTVLGLHLVASTAINTDYIDAYNLVQNFRLAAHSSKMTRYDYYSENATTSLELKPAFWPRNRMHNIVPDYEQALVKGSLDLDVAVGKVPVTGIGTTGTTFPDSSATSYETSGTASVSYTSAQIIDGAVNGRLTVEEDPDNSGFPGIFAELADNTVTVSLMDIDKARTTNAFARRVAQMEGSNFSGFNNDDVLMAELMQGFTVPNELLNRPWLIDSQTVVFGMNERHATDAANLDDSVVTGQAQVSIAYNVPTANYGGIGMVTVEVMPERLYERQSDEYLYCTTVDDLPNAMRDSLRTEPVDIVLNRRVDAAHTTPAGTFGYEPMNAKWRRERTIMGGEFRQTTPGTPVTTARTQIWQADYVDPAFTSDHWLCPHPFPQNVFSVPANDIVNIAATADLTFVGHTVFGDDLVEDNGEFLAVTAETA
jgi:hypothetical protein